MDEKKGVLELGELKYHKRWYIPNYFRNSVSDPIISKLSANGPFWPISRPKKVSRRPNLKRPSFSQAEGQEIY